MPFRSAPLRLGPGEQADFAIEPTQTREYAVGSFGDSDTVVVVFEERDGEPRFLAGQDDGGTPHNATLKVRLVKGRRYFVRVRLYSTWGSGNRGDVLVTAWVQPHAGGRTTSPAPGKRPEFVAFGEGYELRPLRHVQLG